MGIQPETRYAGLSIPEFEIIEAQIIGHHDISIWMVKLAVSTSIAIVKGHAFLDPQFVELRFELQPDNEPPGFFTGRYLLDAGENNSLALLYDQPSILELCWIEESIKQFLEKCIFCVSCLFDVNSGKHASRVDQFRYAGQTHTIKRLRNK